MPPLNLETSKNIGIEKNNETKVLKINNSKRDQAAIRNLMALRNIIGDNKAKPSISDNNSVLNNIKQNDSQVPIILVLNKRRDNVIIKFVYIY